MKETTNVLDYCYGRDVRYGKVRLMIRSSALMATLETGRRAYPSFMKVY